MTINSSEFLKDFNWESKAFWDFLADSESFAPKIEEILGDKNLPAYEKFEHIFNICDEFLGSPEAQALKEYYYACACDEIDLVEGIENLIEIEES